jgi:violaxanthin de-epoxidase
MPALRNLKQHCRCPGAFGQRSRDVLQISRLDRRVKSRCNAQRRAEESESGHANLLGGNVGVRAAKEFLESSKARLTGAAAGLLLAGMLVSGGPALATDVAKVGTCLLGNCQGQLARCLADGECLENLICLQGCNGKPDEAGCQIRCGDLYQDQAIEAFNSCAVSDKKCVPQKIDKDVFPVPKDSALDNNFDLNNFQGRWYITAGLNPLFDQFDCQEHYFGVPEPGKLYGKINWRINKRDNDFIERNTVQTFRQVEGAPAKLENHGNAFLHYSDDWYILASKPDEYVLIYYIGNNDAWQGYGGATVYTRAASLPEEYIPEISEKLQTVGLKWSDFKVTDNSCKPHPPPSNPLIAVERFAEDELKLLEGTLEEDLKSFGKGFTVLESLEKNIAQELTKDEKLAEKIAAEELREATKFLEDIEKKYEPSFFSGFKLPFRLPFFG